MIDVLRRRRRPASSATPCSSPACSSSPIVIDWRAGLVLAVDRRRRRAVMVRLRGRRRPRPRGRARGATPSSTATSRSGSAASRTCGPTAPAPTPCTASTPTAPASWRAARRASLMGDGAVRAGGHDVRRRLGAHPRRRRSSSSAAARSPLGAVLSLFRYSEMLRQPLERIAEQLQGDAEGARRRASGPPTCSPPSRRSPTARSAPRPSRPARSPVDFDAVTLRLRRAAPARSGGVDLHLAPGTHLGVVGRTGSGKTTLGRLLLRFWDVDAGAVRVGGVDVRDADRRPPSGGASRWSPRTSSCFRASVRDNLTLFGARAGTDDAPRRRARRRRPRPVGRRPCPTASTRSSPARRGLSAGEAQLVAFARAFLADPDLVVLDEASSRLDPVTEAQIAAATHELLAGTDRGDRRPPARDARRRRRDRRARRRPRRRARPSRLPCGRPDEPLRRACCARPSGDDQLLVEEPA